MTLDEKFLRRFIREVLTSSLDEDGWEDPSVVFAKQTTLVDDEEQDELDDGNEDELNMTAKERNDQSKRDTYANANKSLSSVKPVAPSNPGGAQSGRTVGGRKASSHGRVYSTGY